MRALCLLTLLMCSCAASPTQPPTQNNQSTRYGSSAGESLLSFGGALSSTDTDAGNTDTFTAQVGYGQFLTDEREVGAQLLLVDSDAFTVVSVSPYFNWNFRQSERTWYYVGPHLGVVAVESGAFDETEISYGVHGGLRQWVTPTTSYFIEPRYTTSSDFDDFSILFGLSFTFGG